MMIKRKSNPWARMKYVYVLPLAAIAVAAFARPEVSSRLDEISSVKVSDLSETMKQVIHQKTQEQVLQDPVELEKAFEVVEEMPKYPGGIKELMKFMGANVKYPAEAIDKNIQGKVIVQFVIEKDGSASSFKVKRSIDPLLDAEAVRVLKLMPKWTPGKQKGEVVRVRFTIPVNFSIPEPKSAVQEDKPVIALKMDQSTPTETQDEVKDFLGSAYKKWTHSKVGLSDEMLVLVDGVEKGHGVSILERIDVSTIQSIEIMTNAEKLAAYGEKGKNGVVLVTTKK